MSYEEEQRQEKLFGTSEEEEEMSDLEGDQASDNDETARTQQQTGDAQDGYDDEEEATTPKKLPSFKKRTRDVDEEESARLEKVRQELRDLKNTAPSRNNDSVEGEEGEAEDAPIDPFQAVRDEIDREFAKALKGGKKKRKRQDGEDLENSMDDDLVNLRERMRAAAEQDAASNEEKKAATAKLKMLNEVTTMLTNKHYYDAILDNGLLETIRTWLEPLPDRSLPSMDIQGEMLDILDKLPIAGDHLRESGVGKIVYFYTKSTRIEPSMKRKADQLVAKWSRLVIKRSENYKERRHAVQEFRHEDMIHQRKKYKRPEQEPEEDVNRTHVRIPMAVAADYDFAPQSTIRADKSRGARPDNTFRRLNNTMRSIKTGPKRTTPKVSIEGKGMSF